MRIAGQGTIEAMSALISSIVAFIVGGLAILGFVPHQQPQPIPQFSKQILQQVVTTVPSPTTSVSQSSSDTCLLVVDGKSYMIAPCKKIVDRHVITFGGNDTNPSKYFVYITSDEGFWNGPDGLGNHAHYPLGKLTKAGNCYQNDRAKVCEAANESSPQDNVISVPGMSKYTDTDFGFSFWYPSDSVVQEIPLRNFSKSDETIVKRLSVTVKGVELWIDEVNSPSRSFHVSGGACGYCAPVLYYFDTSLHTWMKQYPQGVGGAPDMAPAQFEQTKIPKPADVSFNTMGGLHIFSTEQKENAAIIPLSAQHFVEVGDYSGKNPGSGIHIPLIKTIIATDPAVATPVSAAEQIKTIQAEKDAYAGQ